MKLRWRFTYALAAIAAAAAVTVGVTPGSASAALSDCPTARFCIFENSSGVGHYAYFQVQAENLADPDFLNGYMNDKTSAVWNRTSQPWCIFEHEGFSGRWWMIGANTYKILQVTNNGFYWNDQVSSVRYAFWTRPAGAAYYHWACWPAA
jgi:hypothetical protein